MIIIHQQHSKACFLCIVVYRQKQIPSTDTQTLHYFYDELARCHFLLKNWRTSNLIFVTQPKIDITLLLGNTKAQ